MTSSVLSAIPSQTALAPYRVARSRSPPCTPPSVKRQQHRVNGVSAVAIPQGGKGKGKGLDTCYSAIYMSQTRE